MVIAATMAGLAISGCAKKRPDAASMLPPLESASGQAQTAGISSAERLQADLVAAAGSDRVLFELDSANLTAEARETLVRQVAWLRQHPAISFTVEGHCDERGTRDYNLALGSRRANAVANYLATQGIASTRLRTISYGKERPEALGSDESAHAQNRRAVSIVITLAPD